MEVRRTHGSDTSRSLPSFYRAIIKNAVTLNDKGRANEKTHVKQRKDFHLLFKKFAETLE